MIISNFLIKEKINALIKQFKETSFLLKKKRCFMTYHLTISLITSCQSGSSLEELEILWLQGIWLHLGCKHIWMHKVNMHVFLLSKEYLGEGCNLPKQQRSGLLCLRIWLLKPASMFSWLPYAQQSDWWQKAPQWKVECDSWVKEEISTSLRNPTLFGEKNLDERLEEM